jgi:hypothetical protein
VGLVVMLVGLLLVQNACVLVWFAALKRRHVGACAIEGAQVVRFRLMTSAFAFIAGLRFRWCGGHRAGNQPHHRQLGLGRLFGCVRSACTTFRHLAMLIRDENESPFFEGVEPVLVIEKPTLWQTPLSMPERCWPGAGGWRLPVCQTGVVGTDHNTPTPLLTINQWRVAGMAIRRACGRQFFFS